MMNTKVLPFVLFLLSASVAEPSPDSLQKVFIRSVVEGAVASGIGLALEYNSRQGQQYLDTLHNAFPACEFIENATLQRILQATSIAILFSLIDAHYTKRKPNTTWQRRISSLLDPFLRCIGLSTGPLVGYAIVYPATFFNPESNKLLSILPNNLKRLAALIDCNES